MAAYVSAIRAGQGVLLSRTRKSGVGNTLDEEYSPLFAALGDVGLYGSKEAFIAYMDLMQSLRDDNIKAIGGALGRFTGICRKELGMPASQTR